MTALLLVAIFALGGACGYFLGLRDRAGDRDRARRLIRVLGRLWADSKDPVSARYLHDLLEEECPEVHDDFHAAADERLAERDHARERLQ